MADLTDAQFASFIDRILECRKREDEAKEDTKLVYAELADAGGDKAAAGALVRSLRMDEKQAGKAQLRETLVEEYRERYQRGKSSHVRAREGQSYSEAKGRGFVAKLTDEQMAAALAYDGEDSPVGELTDNQDQIGGNGPDLPVEASTEKQAAGASRPTPSNSAAHSPAERAGEAPSSSPASPARHSDDIDLTIPAFLRRDEGRGYPKREAVEA